MLCSQHPGDVRQISEASRSYQSWSELSFCLWSRWCQPGGRIGDEASLARLKSIATRSGEIQQYVTVCGVRNAADQERNVWGKNKPRQNGREGFISVNICIYCTTRKAGRGSAAFHHSDENKRAFSPRAHVFGADISVVGTLLDRVSTLVWKMGTFLFSRQHDCCKNSSRRWIVCPRAHGRYSDQRDQRERNWQQGREHVPSVNMAAICYL